MHGEKMKNVIYMFRPFLRSSSSTSI